MKPDCLFSSQKSACTFSNVTLPNDQGLPENGGTVVVRKEQGATEAQIQINFQDGSSADGTISCGNTSGFVQSEDRTLKVTLQETRKSKRYRPFYGKHFAECPVVLERLKNLLLHRAQPVQQSDGVAVPEYRKAVKKD